MYSEPVLTMFERSIKECYPQYKFLLDDRYRGTPRFNCILIELFHLTCTNNQDKTDFSIYEPNFDQATEQTYSVETAPFKDGTFLSQENNNEIMTGGGRGQRSARFTIYRTGRAKSR